MASSLTFLSLKIKKGTSIEKESSPAGNLCSVFSPSYCISSVSQRDRKCLKICFIHTEPPLFCSYLCYITIRHKQPIARTAALSSRVSVSVTGSVCEEGSFSSRLLDARCSAASGMLSAAGTRVTVGSGLAAMPAHCCFSYTATPPLRSFTTLPWRPVCGEPSSPTLGLKIEGDVVKWAAASDAAEFFCCALLLPCAAQSIK